MKKKTFISTFLPRIIFFLIISSFNNIVMNENVNLNEFFLSFATLIVTFDTFDLENAKKKYFKMHCL